MNQQPCETLEIQPIKVYAWKGDDFIVLTFPGTASYDEIDDAIVEYFGGV